MMAFSMLAMASCGDDKKDDKKDEEGSDQKKEAAAEVKKEFSADIAGSWKIAEKDENAGIDGSVVFTFFKDSMVMKSGSIVLIKEVISADDKSFSVKDMGDTPLHFNYTLNGDQILLDQMYNGNVYAKYKLTKN